MLAQGEVDVALVPAIEYQRIPGLTVVPTVCIGSRERVRSVVLVSKINKLKNIRTVALDESSRTSAALIKIIFREFLGVEPRWMSAPPNLNLMLQDNDAALLIGDPAMTFPRQGLNAFDLAALWREHTGLGFVFAMWMRAQKACAEAGMIDFVAACREGLAQTDEIIDFYQPLLGLSRDDLQTYLRDCISFFLDDELRAGLNLFYKLAHKHSLIPALQPLNF